MGVVSMKLHVFVRKVQRNVEDYGWGVVARKTLAHLLRLFYFHQVYRIYRIELDGTQPAGEDVPGFTFKLLGPEDCDAIAQIESHAEWLHGTLQRRLGAGDMCLAVLEGSRVAGFNLVTFGTVHIPLVNLRAGFRAGEAWSEHIAVLKEFRQRGLAAELRYRIFAELRRRGIRRLYGGTLSSNLPSLKLTRHVGFREIVDVDYRRVLHCESWRYRRVKP